MKKLALVGLLFVSAIPFVASAYVDCRETDKGCTVAQLVAISSQTFLSAEDRIAALQQAITTLTKQRELSNGQSPDALNTNTPSCIDLSHNINPGSKDSYISHGDDVSALQQFLGVSVTGYYGTLTADAVVRWQKAHGMDFVTAKSGVGPMTRGKMACTQTVARCPTYESKPVISSISPTSGPVGTTIEIQGCNFLGFEGDKTVWFTNGNGEKAIWNAQSDEATRTSNTTLRVTLPAKICQDMNWYSGLPCKSYLNMTPGIYSINTRSYGGDSNMINFTVTN